MALNLVLTAAVALICGALGAMGYAHFYESRHGQTSSSHSTAESGTQEKASTNGKLVGELTAEDVKNAVPNWSTVSSTPGTSSGSELAELKDQMRSLNLKIDRLGTEIDRVQNVLSLAVPLLQRLAPN
jgi:hypothetical protein